MTPLHLAVKNNDAKILSLLLERGADFNAEDATGGKKKFSWKIHRLIFLASPLFTAFMTQRVNVISMLTKQHGVSPFHKVYINPS